MKLARVLILGFVQGIGFRQWIKNKAISLGLSGWVRNIPDGRVEAVLQGAIVDTEKMILLCKKGPFLSEIRQVKVEWEDTKENFETFEIIV